LPAWAERLPRSLWVAALAVLALGAGFFCVLALGLSVLVGREWVVRQNPTPLSTIQGDLAPLEGHTETSALTPTPGVTPLVSGAQTDWLAGEIPLPDNIELETIIGSPQHFSFVTQADYPLVLAFYQRALIDRGWTRIAFGSRITDSAADLYFAKEGRQVAVRIAWAPSIGTLVEIVLEELE
jgi:hypothetical protein